ncbi:MAG: electron transport complex subunit RsxD [Pseudomonadota bacterium]
MSSPYITKAPGVSTIMLKVLAALIPGIAVYVWYFGPAILISLSLATATALGAEAVMLRLRKVGIKPFLLDGSAVVTAWLIALSIPPLAPWWLPVIATAFAIAVAKHLYGGLGNNLFNPAMVGYAVMIVSFPVQMTQWLAPEALTQLHLGFADQLHYVFTQALPDDAKLDAVTMATPLDTLKTQLHLQRSVTSIQSMPIFGTLGGHGTEIIALAYLLGGIYLWQQRIITWHVPAAFIAALALIAGAFYFANPAHYASPLFHLASGGAMLGAFFIATDPVTGPTTPRGKLIFAAGIGLLTYLIRVFGGYPDGVAFAVLIMNIAVPLIDAYTQPPVFGKKGKSA